jgi:mannosyltransferase
VSAPEHAERRRPAGALGRVHAAVWMTGLTALGFALRVAGMGESLLGDELFTYEISRRAGAGELLDLVQTDLEISPPLYFLLAWLAAKLGDAVWLLRLPALLAGTALIPLVYLVGVRLATRSGALLATALAALSPFMVFYSTEARAYSLAALLVLASTYALLQALDSRARGWWAAYALASCLAMYAHYTAALVLAPQAAWALWTQREHWRAVLAANGAAALAFAPWLPSLSDDTGAVAQRVIGAFEPFGPDTVQRALLRSIAGNPFMSVEDLPGVVALALLGLAGMAALAGLVALARGPRRRPWPPRTGLLLALALGAPVGAALYSLAGDDIYIARNMSVSLPGIWLLAGALVAAIPRAAGLAAGALTLAAFAIGAALTLDDDSRRPAYRDIARYIDATARPGDAVLELALVGADGPPGRALEIWFERPHPSFRVRVDGGERRAVRAARGGRLYFVVPRVDLIEQAVSLGRPAVQGLDPSFRLVSRRDYAGLVPMSVYVYADRPARRR